MICRTWLIGVICLLATTTSGFAANETSTEEVNNKDGRLGTSNDDYYGSENYYEGRRPYGSNSYNRPYSPYYTENYNYEPKYTTFVPTSSTPIEYTREFDSPCGITDPSCYCSNSPYRTFSGVCNNLQHGSRGSMGSPLARVLPARYKDDFSVILTRTPNGRLPKPRVISETVFKDRIYPDSINARSVMEWGQLLSHDVSLIRERLDGEKFIKCCTDEGDMIPASELNANCIPIEVPKNDPFYSKYYVNCINMVRSRILSQDGCQPEPIQQISLVSHFIDASFLYGSSDAQNEKLREFKYGLMKTKERNSNCGGEKKRSFLPNVEKATKFCDVESDSDVCYMAGDMRVNQNPFLSALQTIFLREHNRLARELVKMHPLWSDDTVFQEARRIVIGQWQHITYEYWLPRLIGTEIMENLGLDIVEEGFSYDYDPDINPSTINEFTTAAYRFFHSTIPGRLDLHGEGRCPFANLRLSNYFFKPAILEKGDNFDGILRGSIVQANEGADQFFSSELTKFLFKSSKPFGADLESFDVQRGRDHGLPSYNDMREACGLPKAEDFNDLRDVMTEKNIHILANLYRSVDDVDLFVGGTLEKLGVYGDKSATVGPTFGCIIGEQFLRWKKGDRYFVDLGNQAGSFTIDQLNSIRNANFSSILCDNLDDLKFIQNDAFIKLLTGNELLHCYDIPRLDLTPWKYYQPNIPSCYTPQAPVT